MTRSPRQKLWSGGRARRVLRSLAALLLGLGMAVADSPARGQVGPSDPDPNEEQRMQAMDRIARGIVLQNGDGGLSGSIAMRDHPIYRFDDPARRVLDGTVWAWGRSGRPTALMTLSVQKKEGVFQCLVEFSSLTESPISATVRANWAWTPQDAGAGARALPGAPRPAEDEAKRLLQIKGLARRFRAFEFFEPVARAEMERYELRLLPQPLLRYSDPKSGLLDGAAFVFAYGSNPEIALLIEARRMGKDKGTGKDESGPSWMYGLARIAGAELHVELDRGEVWKQERVPFPNRRDPYAIVVVPLPEVGREVLDRTR